MLVSVDSSSAIFGFQHGGPSNSSFRNAEAAHNQVRDGRFENLYSRLNGMKQAKNILKNYQFLNHPSLILTSPLRRTIQTVLKAFHPSFNRIAAKRFPTCPRIIAFPHLQECSELPSDTGLSLAFLKSEYGQYIEFPDEFFSEDWFIKEGTWLASNHDLIISRAEFVRKFILEQTSQEVIVMTHGNFAHFLVNRWFDEPGWEPSLFYNLHNACGTVMVLKKKQSQESDYEMREEMPAWFEKESKEQQSTKV